MKALVVGLGSMGKRRVRNLTAIGDIQIAGFDTRQDRLDEAVKKYDIPVFQNFSEALEKFVPDVLIISTPPDKHMQYAYQGLEKGLHCFIEASVVDAEKILALSGLAAAKNLLMAPSCTMRFFSGPKQVKELIHAQTIGKVISWHYHTGQRLEEWHPWEAISEFYVSKKETGAAREIVPFEMTWLNDLFGTPEILSGYHGKVSNMPADIDDIYNCSMLYPKNVFATMTVEVISKFKAARYLRVIGENGQIVFDGDEGIVKFVNDQNPEWKINKLSSGVVEKQYINPENPYIEELSLFIEAAKTGKHGLYPSTLKEDHEILQKLYEIERKSQHA